MSHTRSKSAPSSRPRDSDTDTVSGSGEVTNGDENGEQEHEHYSSQETVRNNNIHHGSSDSVVNCEPFYDIPEVILYSTIRKNNPVNWDIVFAVRSHKTTLPNYNRLLNFRLFMNSTTEGVMDYVNLFINV